MADMQKDLVLSPNEFAFVQDQTKGTVSCAVGPYKTSLSQSDCLVMFNEVTKKFEEARHSEAIQTFITAPENWYIILKNPTSSFPKNGTSNNGPENMNIGEKINITGPTSFALYPGQMAKAIQGHRLRSNQYLLARVYNADSATKNQGVQVNPDGTPIDGSAVKYTTGQIIVIKGTEVSFYIPPTGIEVLGTNGKYVRDAVTLERLEYCILKDEDGNKRYVHGPDVVFPNPTENFAESKNGYKFKAIELSKISGLYVKVIADYADGDEKHKIGEEIFITGDKQMIYYPRSEHAIIDYDGQIMHHAIAIPAGEGRYVMNRLTGEIRIVRGPAMFLPDPRKEVIIKRKLTRKECELLYPNNREVLQYNTGLDLDDQNKSSISSASAMYMSKSIDVAGDSFNRGSTYTKPRTITLDNKFDGVVSVNVWTGYAINVISKDGTRAVICGPQTVLLEYDQTFEMLEMSTGKPKNTDNLLNTAYLRHVNNKISDIISITTKDFINVSIKLSYCVDFLLEDKDKWFAVENYVKYLCDHMSSMIKKEARKYNIEDFYQKYSDIIHTAAFGEGESYKFDENGMNLTDIEILSITADRQVQQVFESHQMDTILKNLELSDATARIDVLRKIAEVKAEELDVQFNLDTAQLVIKRELTLQKAEMEAEQARRDEAEQQAKQQAKADMQNIMELIHNAEIARTKTDNELRLERQLAEAAIEKSKQEAYAQTIKSIMESISPDLVAALNATANADMLETVTKAMSPYAIAKGESVAEVTNKLLRGTSLENILDGNVGININ